MDLHRYSISTTHRNIIATGLVSRLVQHAQQHTSLIWMPVEACKCFHLYVRVIFLVHMCKSFLSDSVRPKVAIKIYFKISLKIFVFKHRKFVLDVMMQKVFIIFNVNIFFGCLERRKVYSHRKFEQPSLYGMTASIAAWIKNTFWSTSEHNFSYNYLNFSYFFTWYNPIFYLFFDKKCV